MLPETSCSERGGGIRWRLAARSTREGRVTTRHRSWLLDHRHGLASHILALHLLEEKILRNTSVWSCKVICFIYFPLDNVRNKSVKKSKVTDGVGVVTKRWWWIKCWDTFRKECFEWPLLKFVLIPVRIVDTNCTVGLGGKWLIDPKLTHANLRPPLNCDNADLWL